MNKWVDRAKEQGRKAYLDGVPYDQCPYFYLDDTAREWKSHWLIERDKAKKKPWSGNDHIYSPDYEAMGDCRVCGHGQDKPWHVIRRRIVTEEGCPTCAELARGSFGPPHDPSPRCESGKRNHCTCDICF